MGNDGNEQLAVLIYTTLPDEAAARKLGEALVKERLAACVNIFPAMTSIYEWQGKLEHDSEAAMLVKTTGARAREAMRAIANLHPYEEPAILQIPVTGGAQGYLEWLARQTTG